MYSGPPTTPATSTSYIDLWDYTPPRDYRNRKERRADAAKARDRRVPKRKKRRG